MKTFKNVLDKSLLFIVAVLLITMTLLVLWQVFTRYALKDPAVFTEELVRYILIWSSFLGAAYGFGNGEHMALTVLEGKLKIKHQPILHILLDIIVIIFVAFVMVNGGLALAESGMTIKTPILQISKGLLYMILPISGIIIILYQIIDIYWKFLALKGKEPLKEV